MTGEVYSIHIDRVVLTGVAAGNLDAAEIRVLVTDTLTRTADQSRPAARLTVRPAAHFSDVTVAPTSGGVASAVTSAIASAIAGGGSHG
jgi:hypothetical protein